MTDPFTNKAEEILEDLYTATHKGSTLQEGLKDGDIDASDFRDTLKQLTQLHHEEVERIIGEDEVFVDIPMVDHIGNTESIIKGKSYTPYMVARNYLRQDQRNRLNKGDSK